MLFNIGAREPSSELRDRLSTGRLREGDTSSKARRATFTGPGKMPRARPFAYPTTSAQGELAPHRVSKGLGPTAAEHRPGRKSDVARPAVDCFSAPHQSWRRNYEADHTAVDCFALARFMLETKRRDGSICGRPLFAAPSTAAGCHRSATVGEAKVPPTISYSG